MRPQRILICLLAVLGLVSAAGAQKRSFTVADMDRLLDVGDPQVSPEGDWVAYVVRSRDQDADRITGDLYMVRWDGSQTVQLTHTKASESQPRWSPDGRYLAFLATRADGDDEDSPGAETQIYLLDRAGGEADRLTLLPGGVSDYVWSPDGKRLAIISTDPEAKDEPEATDDAKKGDDGGKKSKTPKPIVIDRYQFKRDRIGYLGPRRDRLYVFDLAARKATLLTPGDFDNAAPTFSPDGQRIAFSSKRAGDPDRHHNSDLYVVEARDGAVPQQLTQADNADGSPAWSADGRLIAYRQGGPPKYNDYDPGAIAVVPAAGGAPRVLTADLDRDVGDLHWSADGKSITFLLEDDRDSLLARVPAAGGKVERLESAGGAADGVTESYSLGRDDRIAAQRSQPQQPDEIYAREGVGWRALSHHNQPLLDELELATVDGVEYKSADGAEVHGVLYRPPGFTTGRRYPTIAYIHGGPTAQDGYGFDYLPQLLAANGYVVIKPNYRGSSGRGHAYARAIYADWGHLEVQDILAGIDHLVATGVTDPDRLGIGGWSYGGMSTNYTIATDTRFKAAVSGAGISNMITGYGTDQYIVQYENEVGLPWQELDVYFKISFPFFHADKIKTPTLFLCGEKDFNVPLINSEQMYQALRSLGVPTRLVIYPGQYHGLSKPSYQQDRMERMLEWYGRYLKEDGAGGAEATSRR